jgi:hypothetical protein
MKRNMRSSRREEGMDSHLIVTGNLLKQNSLDERETLNLFEIGNTTAID